MDHFALLPAPERAIVFRETAVRLRLGSATIVEKESGSAGRFKGSSRVRSCRARSSRAEPHCRRFTESSSLSQLRKFTFSDRNAHSGRRQRCSMQSSTRERCRSASRAIIAPLLRPRPLVPARIRTRWDNRLPVAGERV